MPDLLNSVKSLGPGLGSANYYYSMPPDMGAGPGAGAASGPIPIPFGFPPPAPLTPVARSGAIRVQMWPTSLTAGSSNQVNAITGTDGTATVVLYPGDTAASPINTVLERLIYFITDLNLTGITVNFTSNVGTSRMNVEVIWSV
jgi:hypothetical protein